MDGGIKLHYDNTAADSYDDDVVVLALPNYCSPSADSDDDQSTSDDRDDDEGGGGACDEEDNYEPEEEEEDAGLCPPPPGTLVGMFHNTPSGKGPVYSAFEAVRRHGHEKLIPDPDFSGLPEKVTVLASTRGLVCLQGNTTKLYYVANPFTFTRICLPKQNSDHVDPSVVITFDETGDGDFREHYHVVVAFQVDEGVCAFESFSSRKWDWSVGSEICTPEAVISSSGVGALGRAFWRTTIGFILSYAPETGRAHMIPAPQEVETRNLWEIGEMDGNFCVVCMDEPVTDVAVLYFVPNYLAGEPSWAWAGQFDGGPMHNKKGATLLRSQGAAEVVMWYPLEKIVLAMDLDGRVTRAIEPFSCSDYYPDFIPYANVLTDIRSDEQFSLQFLKIMKINGKL